MLGRLRMSIADCEKMYAELSQAIFTPTRVEFDFLSRGADFFKANGYFSAVPLEKVN